MTATSVEPTVRQRWRRIRPVVIAAAGLILAGAVLAWFDSLSSGGPLDPRSAEPNGARAVVRLLEERGVNVQRVDTVNRVIDGARTGTLLVTRPDLLGVERLNRLATAGAARVILLEPDEATVWAFTGGLVPAGSATARVREPTCALPAATRAGSVRIDGQTYRPVKNAAGRPVACYGEDNRAGLVRWIGTDPERPRTVDVLGSPSILTNARLDEHGHAALALNLLGEDERLVWYVPSVTDLSTAKTPTSPIDLLPSGVLAGTAMAAVAVVLLMLAVGRRLGPVVPEDLPVVVRASETVEGRARLYRHARAHDRAALALRGAVLARLRPRLGLAVTAGREAVVAAIAERTGRPGAGVMDLLYGGAPRDDDQLVRLAGELDALEQEVRQS